MGTITLKVRDGRKLDHFLAFIKDLDFIEIVHKEVNSVNSPYPEDSQFMQVGEAVFSEEWDAPENDIWDDFFAKNFCLLTE